MIIHSPIISGSLTFAEGASFTSPNGGVFSGSFSGSINGIGDPSTFSASIANDFAQLSTDYNDLQNIPSGIVSSSAQIDALFNLDGLVSGSSQITYGDLSSIPTNIVSSSSDSSTIDFTISNGTITANLIGGVVSGSSQVVGILSSLNTYTGSNDTTNTTQNSRLNQLSTYTGSNDTTNTTQNSRLDQLSIASGSAITRLNNLELETGSITTEQSVQDSRLSQIETVTSSLDATYEQKASATHTLVSGSSQLTGSLVDLTSDQTIGGLKTFNDIVVNGTGSFAYITSVGGTAKIVGDSYIILNNDTPTQRYAGIAVYDSGSATPTTASFNFDGQTNDWFYEYSSSTVDYAVTIFGPEYSTKGSPTYLTTNRIPKAVDNHHLNDSNISDSGTTITLGSNTVITGTIVASGTTLVSGSSQINVASTTGDIALGTRTSGNYVASLVAGTGVTITNNSGEGTTPTIAIGQAVATTSEVQFAKVGVGGASDATYELKITGDVGATGDIVAYISSDERLKENIELISNPIEKVQSLKGVTWEWNDLASDAAKQSPNVGVIAQDVEKVLPQLVFDRENGFKGVDYAKLTGLLIEAIKEQQKQIDELKSKLV